MSFVFISYSRRDQEKVDRLVAHLTSRQIPYWIDRHGIAGGDEWRRQIVEGIQNCTAFLLILSRNSVASRNVRKEIDLAEHYDKRIIPVEIETVEIPDQLEYQLIGIQRIDLTGNMAAKMGILDQILQPYRQPVSQDALDVTASPRTLSAPPAGQMRSAPRRVEPTEPMRRVAGVAGIYGLAGLLFAVGWTLMFITVIFIRGGYIDFRNIYYVAPNYLFLFGNDFRYGISPAELAVIYPITWLVPGIIVGWLLPAIRPYLKGLGLWLGAIVVIGLIGELIVFTVFYKQLFVSLSPSLFIWRGWFSLIVLVGGPLSTLFYAWSIRKRMGS